ncbi:MAG: AAA family ATPase [Bacteroidales bacterium]|nr:AAA family ATPase [Bacteroidales bacterium]
MQEQYDLFTTNSGTAGYRLNYLEIFNWGTFNGRIYRIAPQCNNSLLTGANASGKSTLIDALLTLLVPAKKDRFYNQSSGIEKKGDRTEETYVLGNYGNILSEGETTTKSQQLRDKSTYSVILASFVNNHQNIVTLFQVRWFVNGELKCSYGFSNKPLTIEKDFSGFNGSKGDWKKLLEKQYNTNVPKKQIEFYDTIKDYKDRFINALGMHSDKALTLFNQIVGVKVLNDLDDFIHNNMLEQRDAESEYIRLNESFSTLIEAKTKIEKDREQIAQLEPIDKKAKQLESINSTLDQLQKNRELGVYWFAKRNVELANARLEKLNNKLTDLNEQLKKLNEEKENLKRKERTLSIDIENDNVGKQIKELEVEIKGLETKKQTKLSKLEEYNKNALKICFNENPTEAKFYENRERARKEKVNCESELESQNDKLRLTKNKSDSLKEEIDRNIETLEMLQKNKNNISGREAEIRDLILQEIGATPAEIPFIGELIRVKVNEKKWENTIEKILHNFALRLIVPEKYYKEVNQFVNSNNLKGRIQYQKFTETDSLRRFQELPQNCLLSKIEFNPKSKYSQWVEDVIFNNYNYACVSNLDEFYQYKEKAATIEGLIKSTRNKHEKDDRPHTNSRENYVLGWDNKEKMASIRALVKELQEQQKQTTKEIREIKDQIKEINSRKDCFDDIIKLFKKFDDINWEEPAQKIQEITEKKNVLEATNEHVKEMEKQLKSVQQSLEKLENETIKATDREIYQIEQVNIVEAKKRLTDNNELLSNFGVIDVSDFETGNAQWLDVNYDNIESKQKEFQTNIQKQEQTNNETKEQTKQEVVGMIMKFKNPTDEITQKFKDWRSDVHNLPVNIDLVGEYQNLYDRLIKDDLVKHEKEFDDYLKETVTNKVSDFRMFFTNWEKSIKTTIKMLNESLKGIEFNTSPSTYIQLVNTNKINPDIADFRNKLENAMPNFHLNDTIDGKRNHFENNIQPFIELLKNELWRKKVMDVRSWFSYKAEEFYKETNQKYKTYESMGQLSGGEKAQLTYTILGSAIAYQFGLTKEGLQSNSFRFIAIDEAFKAQDEDKARYLISLCKQLHLQLLVVTPSDNIHIVENDISFVHYVERNGNESRLFDMRIEIFKQEREKYQANDNAN